MERSKQNGFVLYTNYSRHVSLLSDQEAGQLFKALFQFVEDGTAPHFSGSLEMCFSFISDQIQRDKEKYNAVCEKRAEAGRKGGKQKQANLANANLVKQKQANLAENDNVTENNNVTENDKSNIYDQQVKRICDLLNVGRERKASKGRIQPTKSFKVLIEELLEMGFGIEEIISVACEIGIRPEADRYMLQNVLVERKAKGGI